MAQAKLTREHIQTALDEVSFMDRKFLLLEKGDGFLIQMSYMEANVENPVSIEEQKTRKWYVSPYSTETEIIETCWAMVCRSQMHIAAEHFHYRGRRVYSPHFDINARINWCDQGAFDGREPMEKDPV